MRRRRLPTSGVGCGYVLMIGAIVIGLLFLNGVIVKAFVDSSLLGSEDLRVTQSLQFALPLLMIFIEFWIFDLFRP